VLKRESKSIAYPIKKDSKKNSESKQFKEIGQQHFMNLHFVIFY
jgi:hypothetical protein